MPKTGFGSPLLFWWTLAWPCLLSWVAVVLHGKFLRAQFQRNFFYFLKNVYIALCFYHFVLSALHRQTSFCCRLRDLCCPRERGMSVCGDLKGVQSDTNREVSLQLRKPIHGFPWSARRAPSAFPLPHVYLFTC